MRFIASGLILILTAGCSSAAAPSRPALSSAGAPTRVPQGIGYNLRFTLVTHGDPGACSESGVLVSNPSGSISVAPNSSTLVQIAACNAASGNSVQATVGSTFTESPFVDTQVADCGDGASSSDCGDFAINAGSTGYATINLWDRTTGATSSINVTIGTP